MELTRDLLFFCVGRTLFREGTLFLWWCGGYFLCVWRWEGGGGLLNCSGHSSGEADHIEWFSKV